MADSGLFLEYAAAVKFQGWGYKVPLGNGVKHKIIAAVLVLVVGRVKIGNVYAAQVLGKLVGIFLKDVAGKIRVNQLGKVQLNGGQNPL